MKGATFKQVVFEYIDKLREDRIEYGKCILIVMHKFELTTPEASELIAAYLNETK